MYDNLKNTGLFKTLILEVVVNLISPYPFFENLVYTEINNDYNITFEYKVNDILLAFSFIRVYLLIRYIMVIT
jgi:hypothetical protein